MDLSNEERRPKFEEGEADAEDAQLEQVERCMRTQILWLSDAAQGPPKNASFFGEGRRQSRFLSHEQYYGP